MLCYLILHCIFSWHSFHNSYVSQFQSSPSEAKERFYRYLYHTFYKYEKKRLLKVKPQAEVFAFGVYMFKSLQSFNNSQVKAHSMLSMSNLVLICQNCRTSAIYVTKLQSLLRGQLNRHRYIFDINRLPYSVACITLIIVLTKTLPFWYLTSKHRHRNTVNVLGHVSAARFPSVRDFRSSP